MTKTERIQALLHLGDYIRAEGELLQAYMKRTEHNNLWFTLDNQWRMLRAIANDMLEKSKLEEWLAAYTIPENRPTKKTVALVLAGNIPLVGFHDILCVFAAGHKAKIKLSEKGKYLLPHLLDVLKKYDAQTADYFEIIEQLTDFQAVIATGSNNSARYFEAYFSKYPHIIRKNRNGIAVLTGNETAEDFRALGEDIFAYFGLGCRNVSKLYLPKNYDFNLLMETLHEHREMVLHSKYKNNFDYNFALYALNKTPIVNNGCLMLVENESFTSRIAALHYEYYEDIEELEIKLASQLAAIQVIVTKEPLSKVSSVRFGAAQRPALSDYADGVDTMEFLLGC